MSEFVSVMASRIGPQFVNFDAARFAVVPDLKSGPIEMAQDEGDDGELVILEGIPDVDYHAYVDMLTDAVSKHQKNQAKQLDFIEEVYGCQENILWPVGLLFHQSAAGRIDFTALKNRLDRVDPSLAELRAEFENYPTIIRMQESLTKKDYVLNYWKIFIAMKMSFQGIEHPDDIKDVHTRLLARALRPDGIWQPWLTEAHKKHLRSFMTALGELRDDPLFGQSIGRIGYTGRGARLMSPAKAQKHLRWAEDLFETWMDELHLQDKKHHRRALMMLLGALAKAPEAMASGPEQAFSRPMVVKLLEHAGEWGTPSTRMHALGKVLDFATWLSDRSRDDQGRPAFILTLTASDVASFRRRQPALQPATELAARPMPARYHTLLREIISEGDFAWPKSLVHNQSGRGRLWFTWLDHETGEARPVFSEVLPRLLMLLLDMPLRTVQARRLDSGEGDLERWDVETGNWSPNTGPLAGYWSKRKVRNPRRGVIRRIAGAGREGGEVTGLYINSNKTQDSAQLFDETSGYEIPWQHDEVLANLDAMRRWQEKYNPVRAPLPRAEVPHIVFKDEASAIVRKTQPDRFYLFREPLNDGKRGNEAPPTYPALLQFFHDALAELERRLNAEDPDAGIEIITRRDDSGLPKQAIYSMHGMRSSTLTTLYDQGVPIGMLSKLVAGHATILMTLRYVKYEPAHVSEILTSARQKALAEDAVEFRQTLGNTSFQEAARMTARLSDDGLIQMQGKYAGPSSWSGVDIGICPNSQTLCNVGGERIQSHRSKDGKDKSIYAPVPGGPRNCVRCRFFVTGMPFLIPLVGHSNAISAKSEVVSKRLDGTDTELKDLKLRRHALVGKGEPIPDELRRRIQVLEAEWDADYARRDQYLADFHATLVLVERIRSLGREVDEGTLPMILDANGVPEVTGRDATRFELADAVVQMGRFYPSLASEDIERERDGFLDRVLYNGGYVPFSMAPLDAAERRRAADALAALLLGQLGAQEAENLIHGRKSLSELGIEPGVDDVVQRAIGKPLERLGFPANDPARLPVIEIEAAE